MSKQTNDVVENTESKPARRPTQRQFAIARQLAKQTGNTIPPHAVYSGKAMSGFIGENMPATAS